MNGIRHHGSLMDDERWHERNDALLEQEHPTVNQQFDGRAAEIEEARRKREAEEQAADD